MFSNIIFKKNVKVMIEYNTFVNVWAHGYSKCIRHN